MDCMSMTFTKLFSSITASTVWCESSDTRVVWITMLAMCDRHGRVWASIPGLAKEAAVSLEACRAAITLFLSPDPDSRTKIAEGRRIEEIDGGWKLINHAKYRSIRDEEERRAYKAEKEREYRGQKRGQSGHKWTGVDAYAHNADADADAEADAKTNTTRGVSPKTCFEAYPKSSCPASSIAAIKRGIELLAFERHGGNCEAASLWLLGKIKEFASSTLVKTTKPQFLPSAKNWMMDRRYDDDPSIWIIPNHSDTAPAQFASEREQLLRV